MMQGAEDQVNAEFHAERRKGIFATDVGPIFGMSRFGYGRLDVAVDKINGRTSRPTKHTSMGKLLEPIIGQLYTEETGIELAKAPTAIHEIYPWMGAHGDFTQRGDCPFLVEAKSTSYRSGWGEPGTDQVPPDILMQCQWQISCYNTHGCHVAALFGLSDFEIYEIPRNDELIGLMIQVCGDFWAMLERGELPAPDWDDPRTAEIIPLLYRPQAGTHIILDQDCQDWYDQECALGHAQRTLEKQRKELKARIIEKMGTAEIGYLPDGVTEMRRKLVTVKPHQVAVSETIRLTSAKRRNVRE